MYRIYFEDVKENEEIGEVTNLNSAKEVIKNDILERGFNTEDIEYQEDNYIITEETE